MIAAINEDRKSQTRRLVNPQPTTAGLLGVYADLYNHEPNHWGFWLPDKRMTDDRIWKCPQGVAGDQLWCKETWRIHGWNEDGGTVDVEYRDGVIRYGCEMPEDWAGRKFNELWIGCSDELAKKGVMPDADGKYHWDPGKSPLRWRPPMFMPRWAHRIDLEVIDTRPEQLQDISEADAKAEGVESRELYDPANPDTYGNSYRCPYADLWDVINGKKYPWHNNPFVWRVEFKKLAPIKGE
jgi:hypothetical protein